MEEVFMPQNPFFSGNLVPAADFIGRSRVIRHITQRIVSRGQSTAVIGEIGSGKTSLLDYLQSEEAKPLYQHMKEPPFFSRIDWADEYIDTTERFWTLAFDSIQYDEACIKLRPDYKVCKQRNFDRVSLQSLIKRIQGIGVRWVLLIDDLHLAIGTRLHTPEFYGLLRSLTMRSRGALTIVMTSRYSLTDLNRETQGFYRNGSPYFNFFSERTLGAFADAETIDLLAKAHGRFSQEDLHFLRCISGQLPSLLQVAASALWIADGDLHFSSQTERWQHACDMLYGEIQKLFDGIWLQWPSRYRQAFMVVALNHLCVLLGHETVFEQVRDLQSSVSKMTISETPNRQTLRQTLGQSFSLDELKNLIFDLNIDKELFGEFETKSALSRELISFMERNDRLSELMDAISQQIGQPSPLTKQSFLDLGVSSSLDDLFRSPRYFGSELHQLERLGFVVADEKLEGGWAIRPAAFLWWAADAIVKIVDDGLDHWLNQQGLTTRFSNEEKPQLEEVTKVLRQILDVGAKTLIKKTIDNPEVFLPTQKN